MEILERLENVNFEKGNGLVPTIVQDHKTKEVLMNYGIKALHQDIFNMLKKLK